MNPGAAVTIVPRRGSAPLDYESAVLGRRFSFEGGPVAKSQIVVRLHQLLFPRRRSPLYHASCSVL